MHWHGHDAVERLIASKRITAGHLGILWLLVNRMDGRLGRIYISARELAADLKRDETQTRREIAKLIQVQLLARYTDPRTYQKSLMINPWLVSAGDSRLRGLRWAEFKEALGDAFGPHTPGYRTQLDSYDYEPRIPAKNRLLALANR